MQWLLISAVFGSAVAVMGQGDSVVPREPTSAALEVVRRLPATRMGVDHLGNLWAWRHSTGRVTMIAPDGRQKTAQAGAAAAVQADWEWGIVALSPDGAELRVLTWEGKGKTHVPLVERAFDACWIDAETVATSPKTAEHRVELWHLPTAARIAVMGREPRITPRPGALRPRSAFLRFESVAGRLFSLEAYDGELVVFDREGQAVQRAGRLHPEKAAMDAHFARLDERLRRAGRTEFVSFLLWNGFALARDHVWVLESCDLTSKVAKVAPLGGASPPEVVAIPLEQPCCSGDRLVVWGDWLVLYHEELPQRADCGNVIRRLGL